MRYWILHDLLSGTDVYCTLLDWSIYRLVDIPLEFYNLCDYINRFREPLQTGF